MNSNDQLNFDPSLNETGSSGEHFSRCSLMLVTPARKRLDDFDRTDCSCSTLPNGDTVVTDKLQRIVFMSYSSGKVLRRTEHVSVVLTEQNDHWVNLGRTVWTRWD